MLWLILKTSDIPIKTSSSILMNQQYTETPPSNCCDTIQIRKADRHTNAYTLTPRHQLIQLQVFPL